METAKMLMDVSAGAIGLTLRDLIYILGLAVTLGGVVWHHSRGHSELERQIQHLDDTKAERTDVDKIVAELRSIFRDLQEELRVRFATSKQDMESAERRRARQDGDGMQ